TAVFEVILQDVGFNNGIHRTGLLAESAINALEQINVITRSTPCAILTLCGFNGDGQRRAHGLAQFAGNAAFFAVGVTAQRMQATEAVRLRGFFFRIVDGELRLEEIFDGYTQAAEQFQQHQASEISRYGIHAQAPRVTRPNTAKAAATSTQ